MLSNVRAGRVSDNVISDRASSGFPPALNLRGDYFADGRQTIGVHGVCDWGEVHDEGRVGSMLGECAFRGNTVQEPALLFTHTRHGDGGFAGWCHFAENRFWSDAPRDAWFELGGKRRSLDAWSRALGDRGSVAERAEWPDPARSPSRYGAEVLGGKDLFAELRGRVELGRRSWTRSRSRTGCARGLGGK